VQKLSAFTINNSIKDGHSGKCRVCAQKYRKWRHDNDAEYRKLRCLSSKKSYHSNKEKAIRLEQNKDNIKAVVV